MSRSSQAAAPKKVERRETMNHQMDASYEVLGQDSNSEGTASEVEIDDEVNGEEVREKIKSFRKNQLLRTAIAGVGFAMSVIGIWGDGAADLIVIT